MKNQEVIDMLERVVALCVHMEGKMEAGRDMHVVCKSIADDIVNVRVDAAELRRKIEGGGK